MPTATIRLGSQTPSREHLSQIADRLLVLMHDELIEVIVRQIQSQLGDDEQSDTSKSMTDKELRKAFPSAASMEETTHMSLEREADRIANAVFKRKR